MVEVYLALEFNNNIKIFYLYEYFRGLMAKN